LGTQAEVAKFFDVSRATVWKWQKGLGLLIDYHPEVPRAKIVRGYLTKAVDRVRIAQWLCDEGAISTSYDLINDNTYLTVSGCMTDVHVLDKLGEIIHERVNNQTKIPRFGWMPLSFVKVHSAEAYALLLAIKNELVGLKRMEAEAALSFFPASGYLKGRHSTDEFMMNTWRNYAESVVSHWSIRKQAPITTAEKEKLVESWIANRVRRARYFRRRTRNTKAK
jgi:DNA-binding XRE family transcriptional regulator